MKIIGVGFPRTGTLSTYLALNSLGYNCYHMTKLIDNTHQLNMLYDYIFENQRVDWRKFYLNFNATVDAPGAFFYKELIQEFPGAKVLLNIRDSHSWYRSFKLLLELINEVKEFYGTHSTIDRWIILVDEIIQRVFCGNFEKSHCIGIYETHISEVIHTVDEDKLLIYSPSFGWEPLCKSLDVPVPNLHFPHTNSGQNTLREFFYQST